MSKQTNKYNKFEQDDASDFQVYYFIVDGIS